jgi:hypothetical protein
LEKLLKGGAALVVGLHQLSLKYRERDRRIMTYVRPNDLHIQHAGGTNFQERKPSASYQQFQTPQTEAIGTVRRIYVEVTKP